MGKSTPLTQKYRAGASRRPVALATFRDQMADYARAERLRELRSATHLSREKVAGEIGVTTKTLYEWENGGKIRWPNAKKLAAFYGVEPEGLVSRDIPPPEAAATVNGDVSDLVILQRKVDRLLAFFGLDDETTDLATALDDFAAAIRREPPEPPAEEEDAGGS
jgi:transcriptional regulator with XRE-family HTH domain